MILDGQTIEFVLYLCSNKAAFYNIMDEALLLIEKSESPSKAADEKAIDHADIELFAKEAANVDEEVEFD
jgi:hypothetical protein